MSSTPAFSAPSSTLDRLQGYWRLVWRSLLMLVLILFGLPLVVPTILLCRRLSALPDHGADRAIQLWSSALCRIYGFRLSVEGPMPRHPVLLIANHISWADIEVLHARVACGFVAKAEIRRWPLIGWLASVGGTIFHQRGSTQSLERVCANVAERLRKGRSVAIFPEGRTGNGERLGAFHARLFQAAIDAEVPVQPVALIFADAKGINREVAFGPNESFLACFVRLLTRPSRDVRLVFDHPIPSAQPRRELARLCRQHIASMLGETA